MSEIRPTPVPRPDWSPLPFEGCVGVDGKVLLRAEDVNVAILRFGPQATIHEHPATIDIDVICLEGSGFVSLGESTAPLRAGERIRWPAGLSHRLWTDGETMMTLMVEHVLIPSPAHERGTQG
jgi:quercetin dioxygenase-like cupin family protein